LPGAGGALSVVGLAGVHGELAAPGLGDGALVPDGARSASGNREGDDDRVGATLGGWAPGCAGLSLGTGGLLAVEVDGEVGASNPVPALAWGEWSSSTGVINVMPKSSADRLISSAEG